MKAASCGSVSFSEPIPSPSVLTTQKMCKCNPSCWLTPEPLLLLRGDAQAGPQLSAPGTRPLPLPWFLLLISFSVLTGIPFLMAQTQGRSPLARHKFLSRLGERRMSPHRFHCPGWRGREGRAEALQGELSALLRSSWHQAHLQGKWCARPPAWELPN